MAEPLPESPSLSPSGVGFALSSYILWGITPVYWKSVTSVPSTEVLIPRILWTALLLLLLARLSGRHAETWATDVRGWTWTLVAGLLLATNWGVFIYAVQSDQVIATSLGYYINPLASILLGLLIVGERLNRVQAVAVAIAGVGVATMAVRAGGLPWISLVLAGSFALYGLIHKLAPRPAIAGLTREMLVLSPIALLGLAWLMTHPAPGDGLLDAPPGTQALLSLTGIVTAAPLLLFHAATRRLPLIAVGMFQYLSPTLTLVLAIVVYGEEFTTSHLMGFGCVWIGLALFSADSIQRAKSNPIAA